MSNFPLVLKAIDPKQVPICDHNKKTIERFNL